MRSEVDRIISLLKEHSGFFEIPILVDNGEDVFIKSYELMIKYQEIIRKSQIDSDYIEASKFIVDRLKEIFESYLKGEILKANQKISKIFSDEKKLKYKLSIEYLKDAIPEDELKHLYKARIGSNYAFNKKDMFHIPFYYRSITRNQRYSISGIPCLYLGTSTYVCWEECGRPDINAFWVSRFKLINQNIKILNLTYTIEDIEEIYKANPQKNLNLIKNFLVTSIIRSLCSISVKNTKKIDRIFKEEYIISQLIMQNINSNGIDGVFYLSTKNILNDSSLLLMRNLAFPASDYCINNLLPNNIDKYSNVVLSEKLTDSFELTEPISIGVISSINKIDSINKVALGYNQIMHSNRLSRNKAYINSSRLPYDNTTFYNAEIELQTLKSSRVSNAI